MRARPPATGIDLAAHIRSVPDFPRPGIVFRDITTLLKDRDAFAAAVAALTELARGARPEVIVGIESRGFVFGAAVAAQLSLGFVPVRKFGRLPAAAVRQSYALEYGEDTLEIHRDALSPGQRVVVMDDLLATGGTATAACRLVEALGGTVARIVFLIELAFLSGRDKLAGYDVAALVRYDAE